MFANMEISLEAIISIVGLIFGGGGIGALITWRYQKKKARDEAKQAVAEAFGLAVIDE